MRRISSKWTLRLVAIAFVGFVSLAGPSLARAEAEAICWWECDPFFCRYVCAA